VAQGYLNIGAMTTGSPPTDLIHSLNVGDTVDAEVIVDGAAPLGKAIEYSGTDQQTITALIDSLGAIGDGEILVGCRSAHSYNYQYVEGPSAAVRVENPENPFTNTGYGGGSPDNKTNSQAIWKGNIGSTANGQQAGANILSSLGHTTRMWHRLRATDSGADVVLRLHVWLEGDTPKTSGSTPDVTWTDTSSPYATGNIGAKAHILTLANGPWLLDWISWGTGADVAPLPSDVVGGAATKVVFNVQPANTVVGATMAGVVVHALDGSDVLDTSFTGNVTIALQTGSGTLAGTLTVAAVAGVATFDDLSCNTLNTGAVLRATSSGLTLADSSTFNFTAGGGVGGGSLVGSLFVS
jgi:hypothetical protein